MAHTAHQFLFLSALTNHRNTEQYREMGRERVPFLSIWLDLGLATERSAFQNKAPRFDDPTVGHKVSSRGG
jgi:hypothetical protein